MKELTNFRKYLNEGIIYEEDNTIGYEGVPESTGKPYAIEARHNMLFDEDENNLKTLDGKKDKTFVMFTIGYWDPEGEYYADIDGGHDYDKEKFGKIYDSEELMGVTSRVLDPETGKEMKDEDYDDFVEEVFEVEDEFFFKTQEELIKFDFKKYLKDTNQKLNT
tara:strand:+ start:117 stop:608 length:492 start_codon:yes stop_codon:yes gene_type:complete